MVDVSRFQKLVRLSGLVAEARLDALLRDLADHPDPAKAGQTLSRRLVDAGLLTEWQAEELMRGRYRDMVFGDYRLLRAVAVDERIYLGEKIGTGERDVLKIALSERSAEKLRGEFELYARFDHPNVVRARECGTVGGRRYLALEFVDGPNLHVLVREQGPLEVERAVEILRQAAAGLAHVHARGVVHRDVKPGNLVLDPHGTVKLVDFDLAIEVEAPPATVEKEWFVGTPTFCAPEQVLDGLGVDARADLYSLGGVLYYLLSGEAPVPDGSTREMMMHQVETPLTPLAAHRSGLPPALVDLCERLLRKDPGERPASAGAVLAALTDLA